MWRHGQGNNNEEETLETLIRTFTSSLRSMYLILTDLRSTKPKQRSHIYCHTRVCVCTTGATDPRRIISDVLSLDVWFRSHKHQQQPEENTVRWTDTWFEVNKINQIYFKIRDARYRKAQRSWWEIFLAFFPFVPSELRFYGSNTSFHKTCLCSSRWTQTVNSHRSSADSVFSGFWVFSLIKTSNIFTLKQ